MSCMNSQPMDMRNRRKPFGQFRQLVIDNCKRVAAAKQDFVNRVVGRDPIECWSPVVNRSRPFAIRIMATEAVPAMNRTAARGNHQNPARVLFAINRGLESGRGIVNRVGDKTGRSPPPRL